MTAREVLEQTLERERGFHPTFTFSCGDEIAPAVGIQIEHSHKWCYEMVRLTWIFLTWKDPTSRCT